MPVSSSASLIDVKTQVTHVKIVYFEYLENIEIEIKGILVNGLWEAIDLPSQSLQNRALFHERGPKIFKPFVYKFKCNGGGAKLFSVALMVS